jgi:syntaxin-binding protein 1
MGSLRECLKKRIVEDVLLSVEPSRQKVLVVDRKSVAILDSAMRTNEVVDHKVTLIEQIEKARQPFQLPAIYLLTPSVEIVTKLVADFSRRGPPLYQGAYLFFTSALDDSIFKKLTKSAAAPYIRAVKELFIDFLAYESEVFTCARPLAFNALYAQNSLNVAAELTAIAQQVYPA